MSYNTFFETLEVAQSIKVLNTLAVEGNLVLPNLNSSFITNQNNPGYGLLNVNGALTPASTYINIRPNPGGAGSINYNQSGSVVNNTSFSVVPQDDIFTGYTATSGSNQFFVSGTAPLINTFARFRITGGSTVYTVTGKSYNAGSNITTLTVTPFASGSGGIYLTESLYTPNLKTNTLAQVSLDSSISRISSQSVRYPTAAYAEYYASANQQIGGAVDTAINYQEISRRTDNFFITDDGQSWYWPDSTPSDPNFYILGVSYNHQFQYYSTNNPTYNCYSFISLYVRSNNTEVARYGEYTAPRIAYDYPRMAASAIVPIYNRAIHGIRIYTVYTNINTGDTVSIIRNGNLGTTSYPNETRLQITLIGVN